mgnify:CR=1 FL=1
MANKHQGNPQGAGRARHTMQHAAATQPLCKPAYPGCGTHDQAPQADTRSGTTTQAHAPSTRVKKAHHAAGQVSRPTQEATTCTPTPLHGRHRALLLHVALAPCPYRPLRTCKPSLLGQGPAPPLPPRSPGPAPPLPPLGPAPPPGPALIRTGCFGPAACWRSIGLTKY